MLVLSQEVNLGQKSPHFMVMLACRHTDGGVLQLIAEVGLAKEGLEMGRQCTRWWGMNVRHWRRAEVKALFAAARQQRRFADKSQTAEKKPGPQELGYPVRLQHEPTPNIVSMACPII